MNKKYRYAIAIVGEVPARNRSQAYMLVQMGFAVVGRLLNSSHDIAIEIEEIESDSESEATDPANELFKEGKGVFLDG